jgi:hypothetical protein
MSNAAREHLISERVTPVPGTGLASTAARGEPALPAEFTWREQPYRVVEILSAWKTTGPCSHGSAEQYVRRHWYRVRTEPDGIVMTLYFDRQARKAGHPKDRWWLYSTESGTSKDHSG